MGQLKFIDFHSSQDQQTVGKLFKWLFNGTINMYLYVTWIEWKFFYSLTEWKIADNQFVLRFFFSFSFDSISMSISTLFSIVKYTNENSIFSYFSSFFFLLRWKIKMSFYSQNNAYRCWCCFKVRSEAKIFIEIDWQIELDQIDTIKTSVHGIKAHWIICAFWQYRRKKKNWMHRVIANKKKILNVNNSLK